MSDEVRDRAAAAGRPASSTPQADRAPAASPVPRLRRGVLSVGDIAAATMANIGPAMSFFFGFAVIVVSAGVAAPLTIVVAAVVIGLLGNTLAEFSRVRPSTGSFVTFVGTSFGPVAAVATLIVLTAGYMLGVSAVVAITGGWTDTVLDEYVGLDLPWQALTLVLTLGALSLMVADVRLSTRWVAVLLAFEVGLLLVVAVGVLVQHAAELSLAPLDPGNLQDGFSGLALGFPLAVYAFVGWENSAAMAEETAEPRRNVPRAIFASVALMAALYVLLAYTTIVAFDEDPGALSEASVPFVAAAEDVLGVLALLAYLAGLTSIAGSLIAGINAEARIVFNAAREGLAPKALARVTRRSRTPWASLVLFVTVCLALVCAFGWSTDPVVFFGQAGTLGGILISVVYLAANLALPVYYARFERAALSPVRHVLLPVLGAAAIAYPLYQLVKPGQPAPFDRYPLIAAGVIAVAIVCAIAATARDPAAGRRVGSVVADG